VIARNLKPLTFVICLLPFSWCLYEVVLLLQGHSLGADPGKEIVLFNGEWTIRMLLLTLLVTPLRQLFNLGLLVRVRRMLGLFTFFYASMHLTSYVVFLLELRFEDLFEDLLKRPYIAVGFTAYLLLIPLAVTSNRLLIQKLKKRWKRLHRMIYFISLLAVVHIVWLTKSDYTDAAIYGGLVLLLLGFRLYRSDLLPGNFVIPRGNKSSV
jgi:methionine sulfoxide reductase heme-binding subunit